MNIQPVSAFKSSANSITPTNNIKTQPNKTAFSGERNEVDREKLTKALKALALASSIAFVPAMMTSCEKDHICDEDCDHPNHITNPDFPPKPTEPDTLKNGVNYVIPKLTMNRYLVSDADTIRLGKIDFSESVIHVPFNAHKSSELKTVLNFVEALGLNTETTDKEYVATRSFNYENLVPVQLTWLNEKNGAVNQLKLNGYEKDKNLITMDLISIPAEGKPVEQKLELTSAGIDKLLVNVFDKEGENKLNSMLMTMNNDTITQFNVNEDGTYSKAYEYTKNNGTSVKVTNRQGEESKLANFNTVVAASKEEE